MRLILPFCPLLNRYYRYVNGKVLISKAGRLYRQAVAEACLVQLVGVKRPLETRLKMEILVVPPDHRRFDLDGTLKAVWDALQHAFVYVNDSQIDELQVRRLTPSPKGHLDITLTELPLDP